MFMATTMFKTTNTLMLTALHSPLASMHQSASLQ